MNCGDPTLNTFEQFCTEAQRLGRSFQDRDFFIDENLETAGLMAMFQSYGGIFYGFLKLCKFFISYKFTLRAEKLRVII